MTQLSKRAVKQERAGGLLEGHTWNMFLKDLSESEMLVLTELLSERLSNPKKMQTERCVDSAITSFQSLSSRESQVLTLIANGYTRSEIADALQISPNTAATHIASIYRKLDIRTIAEATLHACRWGLIS